MKKFYMLLPLVLTALFAFYYVHFTREKAAKDRIEAQATAQREAEAERQRIEFVKKQDAEAKLIAEQKKQIAAEKRAKIESQTKLVKELNEKLDNLNEEREEKAALVQDLRDEAYDLVDANERLTSRLETLKKEKDFLIKYVPVSESNVSKMRQFLHEVDAWEKNQAQLAKDAAKAAAANSR